MDKNVYVILSTTQSYFGKAIRGILKNNYNHASISLDENLLSTYSFGRMYVRNPLVGGMIEENPYTLSFGSDIGVNVKIYKIPVTEEQYLNITKFITNMFKDEEKYYYNFLGVFGILFGKNWTMYKSYLCSEFVIASLKYVQVEAVLNFKELSSPSYIEKNMQEYYIYEGNIFNYPSLKFVGNKKEICDANSFFIKKGVIREIHHTFTYARTMMLRIRHAR